MTDKELQELFEKNKKEILTNCRVLVKKNGYSRVGHAMKGLMGEDSKDKDIEDKSYHQTISALLRSEKKYIREPVFNKNGELDDYLILENTDYDLNESTITSNRVIRRLTFWLVIIAALALLKDILLQKEPDTTNIIATHNQLNTGRK
jgi:hypothetical protein